MAQGTEAKGLLPIALARDKASVTGVQNDTPGHAALEMSVGRALIFGMLLFISCCVQFWCNLWRKFKTLACRSYLKITVYSKMLLFHCRVTEVFH